MEIAGLKQEIIELNMNVEALTTSPNDYVGDNGEVMYRDIKAVWHRPHHECGDPNTKPDKEVTFIETQMKANVDFIGLGEYEASNVIRASTWKFGMIGATCKYDYTEPVRLYYNKNYWTKKDSYPKSDACQDPQNPPGGSAVAPWKCGKSDVVPNKAEGECCSCTYKADQANNGLTGPQVEDRTWVAGIFQQTYSDKITVCVVATGMIHPYPKSPGGKIPQGTGTIGQEVANFCGSHSIIFMADTNLILSSERTRDLFQEKPLSDLRDSKEPRYTCCKNNGNTNASDRIAVTGTLVIDQITGGASDRGRADWPRDMDYQCKTEAEHLPIKADISYGGIIPIPKNELKCFPKSGFDSCLEGYYGFGGSWDFSNAYYCHNVPDCEKFCNECAGGPCLAHSYEAGYRCSPGALEGLGESLGDWKPIPKKDLKCSGSDYVKCLDAYIRPDGVWVLDEYDDRGPLSPAYDPECIGLNWPKTSEQLCNACAGGCADNFPCTTDGSTFCKPPCTGSYEDPNASGKNVPCCDGLEEQLNTWDRDGKYYYKCMDKDAWKPIKRDLKCSGSDYFKCLNAYIRPYDGVWVLEEPDPRGGPPDPECTNWPKTNEQLCNACAGGCAPTCSTDGSTFCKPPKN